MLSSMQNKHTKTKNLHPTLTQVTHNNDTICRSSSVYMQNGSQCDYAILNIVQDVIMTHLILTEEEYIDVQKNGTQG